VRLHVRSSGIEAHVVATAEAVEVEDGGTLDVARRGHLLALALGERPPGARDDDARALDGLLRAATPRDLIEARDACERIEAAAAEPLGLVARWDDVLRRAGPRWSG
jgi:hypothetical protein